MNTANIPAREQALLLWLLNGESVYTAQAVCKPSRPRCACSDMQRLISRRLLPKTCCCEAFAPTLGVKRPNNPTTAQLKCGLDTRQNLDISARRRTKCLSEEDLRP